MEGLMRIEATFTAVDRVGEARIFHERFIKQAKACLDLAEKALKEVVGLVWHIPHQELHQTFSNMAGRHQLLIVQQAMVAMIYAVNSKKSCFTGFTQNIDPK